MHITHKNPDNSQCTVKGNVSNFKFIATITQSHVTLSDTLGHAVKALLMTDSTQSDHLRGILKIPLNSEVNGAGAQALSNLIKEEYQLDLADAFASSSIR